MSAPAETVTTVADMYERIVRSRHAVSFSTQIRDEFDWFSQSRPSEPPERDYLAEAMAELDDFLGWEA